MSQSVHIDHQEKDTKIFCIDLTQGLDNTTLSTEA